ncbi:MAG: HEAT repeat domain-containing protein [Chloroflexaceae bacterium]|nr:HEAT repeat domain-containing protein [Chloroflexaceae bacterium]
MISVSACCTCYRRQTSAEQPSSFTELIDQQVHRWVIACANAVTQIALRCSTDIRTHIELTFCMAITPAANDEQKRHLLACLAQVSQSRGREHMFSMLTNRRLDLTLHWLIIDQLGRDPEALPTLLRWLDQENCDSFTMSKMVDVIANHHPLNPDLLHRAVSTMRQFAEQPDGNRYLRTRAIYALGTLYDPSAQATLFHLLVNPNELPALRGAAADALPSNLGVEMCRWLRSVLSRQRQPPELVVGVLHALGRAHDRDAAPLILRYAQSDQATVATAALHALIEVGDTSMLPTLVAISQQHTSEQHVRVQAVRALLHLGGAEYLIFLRSYLESSEPSLQLQAMEVLHTYQPHSERFAQIATQADAPLALRLRATELVLEQPDGLTLLSQMLLDPTSDPQLPVSTASLLAKATRTVASPVPSDVIDSLTRCALESTTAPWLRRHTIAALLACAAGMDRGPTVHPAIRSIQTSLGRLIEAAEHDEASRLWAMQALLSMVTYQPILHDGDHIAAPQEEAIMVIDEP